MDNQRHPSSNRRVRPPNHWDDRGGVLRLEPIDATAGKVSGVEVFVTFWKPTADELACLVRGGMVQLTCLGGQPAVNLSTVGEVAGDSLPGLLLPTH